MMKKKNIYIYIYIYIYFGRYLTVYLIQECVHTHTTIQSKTTKKSFITYQRLIKEREIPPQGRTQNTFLEKEPTSTKSLSQSQKIQQPHQYI